jgi:hypothetical protein
LPASGVAHEAASFQADPETVGRGESAAAVTAAGVAGEDATPRDCRVAGGDLAERSALPGIAVIDEATAFAVIALAIGPASGDRKAVEDRIVGAGHDMMDPMAIENGSVSGGIARLAPRLAARKTSVERLSPMELESRIPRASRRISAGRDPDLDAAVRESVL